MIGIIGFGRFGKLSAKYLGKDFKVFVSTRSVSKQDIENSGAFYASLEDVCAQKIIILTVPISGMEDTLKKISPLLGTDSLVIDVCSVKKNPAMWMEKILPEKVSILATHPMFGPDSAAKSLHDSKIVLCPVRIAQDRYEKIKKYLASKGLIIIETTADDHDRQISISLSLTHFIGRALAEFGAKELIIDTEGYKRLLRILDVVTNDTWQLFEDMHKYNPYAMKSVEDFINAMEKIEARLKK